ncbi:hypothetical protein OB236_23750, partial [Paenibacillus sp. WQ 127069]
YFLARSEDESEDIGRTIWTDLAGTVGSKIVTFTTGSKTNYRLMWGMNHGGGLSIDDIQIVRMHSYSYTNSNQLVSENIKANVKINYEYDSNGNLIRKRTYKPD